MSGEQRIALPAHQAPPPHGSSTTSLHEASDLTYDMGQLTQGSMKWRVGYLAMLPRFCPIECLKVETHNKERL